MREVKAVDELDIDKVAPKNSLAQSSKSFARLNQKPAVRKDE